MRLARLLAILCCFLPFNLASFAQTASLDLASTDRTVPNEVGSAAINAGGQSRTIQTGELLTPAEQVALMQIMSSGRQNIQLDRLGAAIGGQINLSHHLTGTTSSLVIPQGVTAINNFAAGGAFNLTGTLVNSGKLLGFSTSPNVQAALINATNIVNAQTGLISSLVPRSPEFAGAISSLDLGLHATESIVNMGAITSSGSISLTAGHSITNGALIEGAHNVNLTSPKIVNAGSINALAGNINIASPAGAALVVDNQAGNITASAGKINLTGHDIDILGGNLLAQAINVYANRNIVMNVQNIVGALNMGGEFATVGADTKLLTLGDIDITGDPTYYNTGNIQITGNLSVSETLSILAGGNITSTNGLSMLRARNATGQGFSINLIAGAAVSPSPCGLGCTPTIGPGTPITGPITVNPNSTNGGNIDLSASSTLLIDASSNTGTRSGGNVTLAAFSNGSTGGRIILPLNSTINTSGSTTGNNGNVTIIAGATSGTSITLGKIEANGGTGMAAGTGQVQIVTAQPTTSNGQPIVYGTAGSITSGNSIVASPTVQPAGVLLRGQVEGSTGITILSGADIMATSGFEQGVLLNEIPVGDNPIALVMTPDGTRLYVANRSDDTLSVVDVATQSELQTIPVSNSPYNLGINPAGNKVYVVHTIATNIMSVIDTTTNTVVGGLPGSLQATSVAITPDGSRAYVTYYAQNGPSSTVAIVDTSNNQVVGTVQVGQNPAVVALNPDGTRAYVTNINSDNLSVIDTSNNTVIATIPVGDGPWGVTTNPSGSRVYVANIHSDSVSVIDAATNTVIQTLSAGDEPAQIIVNAAGTKAYITNGVANTISVMDTNTNTIISTIDSTGFPHGFALNQEGSIAYVTSRDENVVKVIDLNSSIGGLNSRGPVSLTTIDGNIGTANSPITMTSPTMSINAGGVGKDAFIKQTQAATLINSSASGTFDLRSANSITVNAPAGVSTGSGDLTVSAAGNINLVAGGFSSAQGNVNLVTSNNGNLITAGNDLTISAGEDLTVALSGGLIDTTSLSRNGNVQLTAGTQPSGGILYAGGLTVNTGSPSGSNTSFSGNITLSASEIQLDNKKLTLDANGLVGSIDGTNSITTTGGNGDISLGTTPNSINASLDGGRLFVNVSGDLTIRNSASAYDVRITAKSVTMHESLLGYFLSIDTSAANGDITQIGGLIAANTLTLSAGTGSLGHITDSQPAISRIDNINVNSGNLWLANSTAFSIATLKVSGNMGNAVITNDRDIEIGNVTSSGDVLFASTGNSILLNGAVRASNITLAALDNITSTAGPISLIARDAAGKGHNITMVAGADVSIPACQQCALTLSPTRPLNGPLRGGNFDFSATPDLVIETKSTAGNLSGGNVLMAAFSGFLQGTGQIKLPAGSSINTSGSGTGTNGNVTLIAGATSGTSITSGLIIANGGNGTANGTGEVTIVTAQPKMSNGLSITLDKAGTPLSGNYLTADTALRQASVGIGQNISASNGISITAGDEASFAAANLGTTVKTIQIGQLPFGLAVNPSGTLAYVTNTQSNNVSVIDMSTFEVVGTIGVQVRPTDLAISPDGSRVYVANSQSGTVSVIDTATNNVIQTIAVGGLPFALGISPNGQQVYVANGPSDKVSVINTATNTVIGSISVVGTPNGLAFNPSGTRAYVASTGGSVAVIDTNTRTVIASVPVGIGAQGIAVTPNGQSIYVVEDSSVSVIDTTTNTVVAGIPVGLNASSVAISPNGQYVYVTNGGNHAISVISTASNTVVDSYTVGQPWDIALNPTGTTAVITASGNKLHQVSLVGALTLNTGNVTSAPAGDITLTANNLNLNNSTVVLIADSTGGGTDGSVSITARATGAEGNVAIGSAPNQFSLLNSNQNLMLSGLAINAGGAFYASSELRSLVTSIDAASILLNNNVFTGQLTLNTAAANGNVLQNRGTLFAQGITINAGSGDIGSVVPLLPMNISTQNLAVSNRGQALFSIGGIFPVSVSGTAGNARITSTPSINLNNFSSLQDISLSSSNDVTIAGSVSAKNVQISAGASGAIRQLTGIIEAAGSIEGGHIQLTAHDIEIKGTIDVSERRAGRIDLMASGEIYIASGARILANSRSSQGEGKIQLTSRQPGTASIHVENDGVIQAKGKKGIIGFNAGPDGTVTVSGTGKLFAGKYVGFGDLAPTSLAVKRSKTIPNTDGFELQNISVDQGSVIQNQIQVTRYKQPDPTDHDDEHGHRSSLSLGYRTEPWANEGYLPARTPNAFDTMFYGSFNLGIATNAPLSSGSTIIPTDTVHNYLAEDKAEKPISYPESSNQEVVIESGEDEITSF